ncbi:glycosyltransferase involved in cell wall biosynthesis [Methanocalculus alkaliphilus]|nr:glycosyltransferase involved in cell wall biosynthesis [Methanocalculus alkaliphilus]
MCQAFAQNGHEVVLIVPDWIERREPGVLNAFDFYGVEKCFEIEYIPLYSIKGKGLLFGYQAARKALVFDPDLVYGRDVAACFFTSCLKQSIVFESHAPMNDFFYGSLLKQLLKSHYLKKLVVITYALKNYYINNYDIIADKIIVAPDGADPLPNNVVPVNLPNKAKKLQVGYVGHLYPGKGMEIIRELTPRCHWADFHIIGGFESDIKYWKDKMDNLKNIYFHGYVPHSKTTQYLLAFNVVLLPNQKQVSTYGREDIGEWTSPLKLFEYMAAGRAIISSNVAVLQEVLDDGYNALLCDPDDVDSWERALIYLCEDLNLQIRLGENARDDFTNKYSWYSRANRLIHIISQ